VNDAQIIAYSFGTDYLLIENLHRQIKRSVKWGETTWRYTVVIRYIPEVFSRFPRKFLWIPKKPRRWRNITYRSAWSLAQNTEIVATISAI